MSTFNYSDLYDDDPELGTGEEPAPMSPEELWADASFDRVPAMRPEMLDSGASGPLVDEPGHDKSPFAEGFSIRPRPKKHGLFTSKKAREKEAEQQDLLLINRSFQRSRLVAVVNEKGGAGKSPLANEIAAGFGNYTVSVPILLLENNPTGDMNGGLEVVAPYTFDDLIRDIAQGKQVDPLGYATAQPTGRFLALPSAKRRSDNRAALSEVEFNIGWRALDRRFKWIIVDEGNNADYESTHASLAKANAVVIPIVWSEKVIAGAYGTAKHLYEDPGTKALAQNAIFVEALDPDGVDAQIKEAFQEEILARLRPSEAEAALLPDEWGPRIMRIPWVPAWNVKDGSDQKLRWDVQSPEMQRAIRQICAEISVKTALLDTYFAS
jgi:hypothetical protein